MRINIPGLEDINIDDVLGRKPKPKKKKAIDHRRIKLTPKQKSKIAAKPKRKSTLIPKVSKMRGLEDFARTPVAASKPKPKPKPKPRPAIKSKSKYVPPSKRPSPVQRPIRPQLGNEDLTKVAVEKTLGSIPGRGETGMINIPGVGPIQIPMPETPGEMDDWWINEGPQTLPGPRPEMPEGWNEDDVIMDGPQDSYPSIIGRRPDGSVVYSDDDDASEYLSIEETTEETTQGPITQTETQTETETETETETSPPPKPPVNPFKGFVPGNIIGQSFDPKDLSAHQKMVQDARNRLIVPPGEKVPDGGYLTYDNPILGNKQTQFGGYGQPMPTKPLMNYAGLAAPNPPINIDDDDV